MKSYTITVNGKAYAVTVEEGAVSGNAHHQPGIILWALLRFPQRVGVHHVKLNMLQLKLGKRP